MSLKQSRDSSAERDSVLHSTSDCWHREIDRACLRVEIGPDETFIFPYQQFFGAHHVHAGGERLKITFSTHEITLSGHRMEKLLAALQDFAVDWIKPIPPRYRHLEKSEEAVIASINVRVLAA